MVCSNGFSRFTAKAVTPNGRLAENNSALRPSVKQDLTGLWGGDIWQGEHGRMSLLAY